MQSSLQRISSIFLCGNETFVGSTVNVILTRQTCSQCSSRAADSKRQELENKFSETICYIFLITKCRGDSDLGRCTFWVLVKRKPLYNAKFWFFLRAKHVFFLFLKVPKKYTDQDLSLVYILILGKCSRLARKNNFLALGVWFPQPCSSAGRRFAASRSSLQYHRRIVSFSQQIIRCNVF